MLILKFITWTALSMHRSLLGPAADSLKIASFSSLIYPAKAVQVEMIFVIKYFLFKNIFK